MQIFKNIIFILIFSDKDHKKKGGNRKNRGKGGNKPQQQEEQHEWAVEWVWSYSYVSEINFKRSWDKSNPYVTPLFICGFS